ncbi:ATP-binding protein [Omnitrophica bacterium]|nr:ATP-binding protein [Candidatus Omnitrophota bacterium]
MTYYKRDLAAELEKWLDRREILAIRGPRQSGKTTLLRIIKDHLINNQDVKASRVIYVTFEDRDVLDTFSRNPKEYINSYVAGNKNDRFYFLIDEFHYLKDGGQKLKLLYDLHENVKFIITGSSSLELTGGTARFLVGRVFLFNLFQFSLSEYLATKEQNLYNTYKENSALLMDFMKEGKGSLTRKEDLFEKDFSRYLEEYAKFGGYPEVIKTDNLETKQIILKNIYDTYVTRDIIELLRLDDVSNFRTIVALLASDIGSLLNYNSLATDGKTYFRQLKHYLSVLEETFVIRTLRPYHSNVTTELKKNPKVYFVDTGLRNYIINNFNGLVLRQDGGKLIENVVLSELYQKGYNVVKYWRTTGKAEVDFILDDRKTVTPIEVKYSSLKSPELSRGFRNFITQYNPKRAIVFTRGFWGKITVNKTKVAFIPAWYI